MGTTLTLAVDKIVAGGDGLAFWNGRAIFVAGVVPGERVVVAVEERKADWLRGVLVEILEPSTRRVNAACPHYDDCGGCDLMHIDYRSQLEYKEAIVREAFSRIGKLDPSSFDLAMVPSTPFSYRNRIQLHVSRDGLPGFMKASSTTIVPISSCPIAVQPLRDFIERFGRNAASAAEFRTLTGKNRRVMVFAPERTGDKVYVEGHDNEITAILRERPVSFHIKGFFQSNLYLFDYLVAAACSGLSGKRAADLYCGVGPFSMFLSDSFDTVTGVEQNQFTIEYARRNVGPKGIFHEGSVEDWIKTPFARERFDALVCDPPRSGLSPSVRSWLIANRPPVISYVSCDPVSCARDVGELSRAGYSVSQAKIFDFYPQTSHVELCVRLVLR